MNVAQAHVDKRLQLLLHLRNVFQNRQGIGNRHLQQIGDRVPVVLHGQRFVVVAAAAADLAQHVDVGQKIHFDAALALTLARLAAPAGDVERKSSRLIAALARLRQHGVEIANRGEHAGVSRRIRARSAADGRLIDANDLVDVLRARDRLVLARFFARTIQLPCQRAIKNVIDQRGLA